jgi:hypothetical protein
MYDYEKLGAFYLGRRYDPATGKTVPEEVMYDAKDLVTHAVIVGMTGSGKTGLGITLLEEAAIDNIPAIVIDPKGDLGNLMLTFPNLKPADFLPWIEKDEALRQGLTVEECAAQRASQWASGLADWNEPPERITRLRDAADVAIYTPGSDTGLPLTVLKSLDAPPEAIRSNSEALRERTATAVSGLLTLLGLDADPLRSREHILLSNILEQNWKNGNSLDLAALIRQIQSPSFTKIGVMDLESIFPAADRRALAMTVNNVLASPAFASWTQGEPLDIQKLLYTDAGKPRLAIVSIAHLSDQERMFFVTLLLNEMISWMRAQPGTSSLRAILYMDEMFGYLPPSANPPSKTPLLTLLKQARAYGLGLVLATQNPVDLDYKALSNAGTWFLGRLQTERDKLRVLDGLEGAAASSGAVFNRQEVEGILSGLKNRVFLLNNAHDDHPVVFQTRWSLSYLRGPLTRDQIRALMSDRKSSTASAPGARPASTPAGASQEAPPIVPPEIRQRFAAVARSVPRDAAIVYRPALLATGRAHYVDAKSKVDVWKDVGFFVSVAEEAPAKDPWDDADHVDLGALRDEDAAAGARYAELPAECLRLAAYKAWGTAFKNFLYRVCPDLGLYSAPGERAGDFRAKLDHQAREQRDLEMEKLKKKYEAAVGKLQERLRKAQQRVDVEKQQANTAAMSAAVSFGTSVLGALFGRKTISATSMSRASSSMRAATRAMDQRSDIKRAEDNAQSVQDEIESLNSELQAQLEKLKESLGEGAVKIEEYEVRPRKGDISVDELSLLWLPFTPSAKGTLQIAYDDVVLKSDV